MVTLLTVPPNEVSSSHYMMVLQGKDCGGLNVRSGDNHNFSHRRFLRNMGEPLLNSPQVGDFIPQPKK